MGLWLAISFSLLFALTNGFHDAANAIATLVATRGARPLQAIVLAGVFNMLGAIVVGTAVASTIAGIVTVPADQMVAVVGSGMLAASVWNLLTWWRAIPSSSGHALVGGLVGAALADSGRGAVFLGGLDGWRPVGVYGVLIALAVSPVLGLAFGFGFSRLAGRMLAPRDAADPEPDPRGRVGNDERARLQPRCERRAEGDGCDRGTSARHRARRRRSRFPCG